MGPGRGSAAGSIVAYCLEITDVDPLRYDLLFERFLNPERVSMPDIDIDFSVRGREQVMRYVVDKYGRESVAQIVTFGKMFPRAATRDAARVLEHDYGVGDRLAKLIPDPIMGRSPSFEDCLRPGEPLRLAYDSDPIAKQIVDVAQGLEGIVRNSSIHAAAVVIAEGPLTDIVPLQLADSNQVDADGNKIFKIVTQFSMKPVEQLGLLKMDFLGLRNLDVIEDALDIIERSTGVRPDMVALPLDDQATYDMLAAGDSIGVFQFESEGMQKALRNVRPTEFDDLVALNALYRPGAMDQIPTYARGKRNPETIEYPDERLRPITESTKGVILYQEQAMQIAKTLAGFSGAKADDLRKAIGKKNREAMATLRPEFFAGCQASGTSPAVTEQLWVTNEKSADYCFNKCLSAQTRVILPDGTRMRLSTAARLEVPEIMSMWADGEIRPHKVQRIVKTGRKLVYRVRCESGRQVRATAEHRFLTTGGYLPVSEMQAGDTELITTPIISDAQRVARRELHPDMTRAGTAAMHERIKWLWANDAEWRARQMARSFARVRAAYDTGPGYGHCSVASNGMWCASWPEREMCEWLVDQGIDFEMHKPLASGRMCDFYFDGVYWEMDGMDRAPNYFEQKYGDLPYVVVTPEDFRFRVERHMATAHAENGDRVVAIEPLGYESTYDVEMCADGPLNFLANGIVSHNSHAACYALIAYRTAWLKANYPGRVHGGAHQLGHVDEGQGPVLRDAGRADGDRDPAAGRQRLRPRLRRLRGQHPLRPGCRQGRRLRGRRGDQGRPRGRRPVQLDLGLLRARRCARGEQEGDRGAHQVRRVRLDRRDAQGDAQRSRTGAGRRPEGPAGSRDRPGLDLRCLRLRRSGPRRVERRRGLRGAGAPADPGRGVRPARAAGGREGVDRPLHQRPPAQAGARGAARARRLAARRAARSARTRTGSPRAGSSRPRRRSARATATR